MIYENTPQLETERLILRKLTDTPDDMNAMFAILRDQETNTFLPWFPAKYPPSQPHLDLRQTAWYVLPQTGIMGGRHGT